GRWFRIVASDILHGGRIDVPSARPLIQEVTGRGLRDLRRASLAAWALGFGRLPPEERTDAVEALRASVGNEYLFNRGFVCRAIVRTARVSAAMAAIISFLDM